MLTSDPQMGMAVCGVLNNEDVNLITFISEFLATRILLEPCCMGYVVIDTLTHASLPDYLPFAIVNKTTCRRCISANI
jgi:hypothetical protein